MVKEKQPLCHLCHEYPEDPDLGHCAKCELLHQLLIERYSPSPRQKRGPDNGPPECG